VPRSRHLLSDFTGGEVSPRIDARADLERYQRSCRHLENFIVAQQGGVMLRRGLERIGSAVISGASADSGVAFIPWRGSSSDEPDILFEVSGNTLRGWSNGGAIESGGLPYALPITSYYDTGNVQYAQSGRLLCVVNGVQAPMLITVESTAYWSIGYIASGAYPTHFFNDQKSPPKQSSSADFEFVGFAAGNTYHVYVDSYSVKYKYNPLTRMRSRLRAGVSDPAVAFVYSSASTSTNVDRIRAAVQKSPLVKSKDDVVVSYVSGTTYRVELIGETAGRTVTLVAAAESPTLRIANVTNASGREGEEAAWSYPTVVTHGGVWYQCLEAHISTATAPGSAPALWAPLPGAPAYEAIQPSAAWSASSVSYGPGGRGFPRACTFHEQRLVLAGTPEASKAIWASEVGAPTIFTLGPEDNEAWSIELDAQGSPAIRWLTSQRGLMVGTSSGVWVLSAQGVITASDVSATRYSGDRCSPIMPAVVGNEVLYADQSGRQLRTLRWNQQAGPYESLEQSALAEHLARYVLRQVVYAHTPQPMVYLRTAHPGLILAVTYNRAGDLVAFARIQVSGDVLSIGVLFDDDDGDVLWAVVRRGTSVSIERMPYPVTNAPVDVPDPTATVHLDGWIHGTPSGGVVGGLAHLMGRAVTILNDDGTVQGVGTVVPGGPPSVYAPVTVTNNSFESPFAIGWTTNNALATALVVAPVRTGAGALSLTVNLFNAAVISSAPIAVTPGNQYRCSVYWRRGVVGSEISPILVRYYDALGYLLGYFGLSDFSAGSATEWTYAEVVSVAPPGAATIVIGTVLGGDGTLTYRTMYYDDFALEVLTPNDGVVPVTGSAEVVIGEGYTGRLVTMEPVGGNPQGPSKGNLKHWANVTAQIYQSALPKINGDRPSDYDAAGGAYRDDPGALRSGEYGVSTLGHDGGAITIEQDLPHATQVVGLYGDLQVGTGG